MRNLLVLTALTLAAAACGESPAPAATGGGTAGGASNGTPAAPPPETAPADPFAVTVEEPGPGSGASTDGGPFDPFTGDFTMPETKQGYLWDIEHFAFVLTNVQPRMKRALVKRRADLFARYLTEACVVSVPASPPRPLVHGPVEKTSWTAADGGARDVDRDAWAADLVRRVEGFSGSPYVRVHFELLSPVDREDLTGRWTGTCTISIEGRLAEGGRLTQFGQECRFGYTHMGEDLPREDGWIEAVTVLRQWEISVPEPPYAETTDASGIDVDAMRDRWKGEEHWSGVPNWSCLLFDFDLDGHLDLLTFDLRTFLYRGLGDGRFEDVTEKSGLTPIGGRTRIAATAIDCDGDGDDDLLCDEAQGTRTPVHVMYENLGDGTFRRREGPEDKLPPGVVGRGSVADYDGDGRLDVYVCNGGMESSSKERRWVGDRTSREGLLLRNVGDFRFEDMTRAAGALVGHRNIMAASWVDADVDGDMDLILAHHMGENVLLENEGDGTFAQHVTSGGFGGFSMGLDTGDLDGDGLPDLYVANMSSHAGTRVISNLREEDFPAGLFALVEQFVRGDEIIRNHGGFELHSDMTIEGTHASGWAYSPVLLDMDGDGLLDVYCPAGYQSVDPKKPDG